jgi:hypothetical protein
MERELWLKLYRMLVVLDKPAWQYAGRYPCSVILAVYLWAVLHDRPTCWACVADHWDPAVKPERLPSQSVMSRRLRQQQTQALGSRLLTLFCGNEMAGRCKVIDGKPLTVSRYSKDREAGWGYAVAGKGRGYKLCMIVSKGPLPLAWHVDSLGVSEQRVAEQHLLPALSHGGFLLGDSLYDINKLYDLAAAHNHQLVAPRKRPQAGLGKRKHSVYRLLSLILLRTQLGKQLYARRTTIERAFAQLTNLGCGLAPLPNWVRRLHRVRSWVQAKLLILGAYCTYRQKISPTAVA